MVFLPLVELFSDATQSGRFYVKIFKGNKMLNNSTHAAKKPNNSKFLGKRRKSFLSRRTPSLAFVRENKGTLSVCTMPFGAKRATFQSRATGRTAFAYGSDFATAFRNMVRNFNLKYSA